LQKQTRLKTGTLFLANDNTAHHCALSRPSGSPSRAYVFPALGTTSWPPHRIVNGTEGAYAAQRIPQRAPRFPVQTRAPTLIYCRLVRSWRDSIEFSVSSGLERATSNPRFRAQLRCTFPIRSTTEQYREPFIARTALSVLQALKFVQFV
jgi:hypothetical protein